MRTLTCDVAIIGAGTAGLAARRAAARAGARTLLIEAGPGGTTCARVGCMPSKLLLAAARAARDMRDAGALGVHGKPRIDGRAVMARVQAQRDHFVAGVLEEVAAIPAGRKLAGHAQFAGPTTLTVDDHARVEARAVVIAVGARPAVPPNLRNACGERLLTHETVFDLVDLPKSLAVIGAGPLGLELAVAFARLGVRVAVFDSGHAVGGARDPEVASAARAAFGKKLTFHLGVEVEARRDRAGDVAIAWTNGAGKRRRGTFPYILDAAGRPPALEGLDLNTSGLELGPRGVPLFDPRTLRCGQSAVFIAGDANNARPVLHEASAQGELAGANAARYPKIERRPPGVELSVVFTDPDLAFIGGGFDPKKQSDWVIGCNDDNGRARIDGRGAGVLRVYARRADGVIVGGELFGPEVEHLAHLLAWAAQLEMTVGAVLDLPFYHPTMEESLRSCLRDLRAKLA
ncbi:MAG: dihydrolipoyl dehydrogenase [Caulobacteraceae bacterium]